MINQAWFSCLDFVWLIYNLFIIFEKSRNIMMSGIRKHKRILVYFLILAILVFAKQYGFLIPSSELDYNVEDLKLAKQHNHNSDFIFTKEIKHLKVYKLIKKVNIERAVLKVVNHSSSVLSSFYNFKSFFVLFNTSILKLNCVLRI